MEDPSDMQLPADGDRRQPSFGADSPPLSNSALSHDAQPANKDSDAEASDPAVAAAGHRTAPTVPGYRLLRRLGEGGQGHVWQAIRLASDEKVALKIIGRTQLDSPQAQARFEQGFQTLALLDHPNIVKGLDHGLLPTGESWHAMEYVSGYTLTEYVERLDAAELGQAGIKRRLRFPLRAVLDLFGKVCGAVEAAHRVGVIHRDLKPSNILVDETGEPRLVDFGLARLPEAPSATLMTLTGQFIGSPAWASPEQVEGRPERVDVRSDVYALGVVLYHALTGTFPYDVEGPLAQTFDRILHADPVPPRSCARFIDADLQAVMLKALAKSRERRYQTVAEFRADLERYLRGQAVSAKGDSVAYVTWRLIRRHRVVAVAAALVLLLSGVYAVTMTLLYRRATQAEAHARTAADDATRRFGLARDTADFLLTEVDEQLKNVAGAGALRRSLLERSYDRFAGFLTEHSDDPRVQAEAARWLIKLSDIAYQLGRLDEAEAKRRTALDMRQRLLAADPDNPELQEALSINLVLIGDVTRARGAPDKGREFYEQALRIDEQLAARFPDDDRYADNLGYSLERVALHLKSNDEAASFELLLRRHLLAERMAAEHPDNLMRRYALVTSFFDLTGYYLVRGDLDTADLYLRANLEMTGGLIAADPSNMHFRVFWVYVLEQHADYQRRLGDYRTAAALDDQAAAEAEGVLAVEPQQPLFQNALAGVRLNQGLTAAVDGDWPTCAQRFAEGLDLFESLLCAGPASLETELRMRWLVGGAVGIRLVCGVASGPQAGWDIPEVAQPQAVAWFKSPWLRDWMQRVADRSRHGVSASTAMPADVAAALMAVVERGLAALPDTQTNRRWRMWVEQLLGSVRVGGDVFGGGSAGEVGP